MIAFYVFLLCVAAVGALCYLTFFFSYVPGAKDERLGVLEALPGDLGKWVREESLHQGLIREKRYLLADASRVNARKVVIQVRYRHPETLEIVRVLPEETYRRKRLRG